MAGTPLHFAMLAFSALFIAAAVRLDRRGRLRRALAGVVLVFFAVMQTWQLLPGHFDASAALPLHVCDVAILGGAVALLTRWRWARTLVVFWGIGLTTQGFATPVIRPDAASPVFWFFWFNHIFVLLMAVREVAVEGYRPGGRDTAAALAMSAVYAAAMFILDAATGWNYGFVGPADPTAPTLVSVLGPWPGRVAWMSGLAAAWLVLVGRALGSLPGGERTGEIRMTKFE